MGVIRRWQEYARQYGTGGLVRHLLAQAIRPVWESASAEVLTLEPPAAAISARVPLEIDILTPEKARSRDISNTEWEKRWARGEQCYGGWLQQRLVHYSWVCRSDAYIGEIHGRLRVGADDAYVYDCFTDGSTRGLGIFPAVLSRIGQELFAGQTRRIWIVVEAENQSSRKAIMRAGFVPAGTIAYRKVGPSKQRHIQVRSGAPSFTVE
jgi:RimJ/RimL family protein N-acetyltransferase